MVLVLVHPIAMEPGCWWRMALPHAVTPELAGHGSRRYPGRSLSLGELADDLAGTLAAVDDRLDLVGLAFGGCVAQHFALRHPDRLRSLLLANTTSRSDPDTMRQRASEVAAHGMPAAVGTALPRWFTPEALGQPGHPGVEYARRRLLDQDPRMYADCWNAMAAHAVTDQLARIRVPATVVGSARDRSATLDKVREIHDHLPGSRLETLDGPHMVHLEEPDRLSAAIARHLARVRAYETKEQHR